jgi:hypothetical protein
VGSNLTKSSVQRGVRARILELYPALEADADTLLPKKSPLLLVKWCVVAPVPPRTVRQAVLKAAMVGGERGHTARTM